MKIVRVLLFLGLGGLATHLLLKGSADQASAEGLGSFGPDPMDEGFEAQPVEPIEVLQSSSSQGGR